MQLSKLHENTMQCSVLPQIPFNSTSSLSAPLLLPLLHAGVSFISGYLSPVAPKLFPAALTCSRRRTFIYVGKFEPQIQISYTSYHVDRERRARVCLFPPSSPSFLCHGVSGGTGGNSLPPVPRRVHCLCPFRRRRRVVFVGLIRRLG